MEKTTEGKGKAIREKLANTKTKGNIILLYHKFVRKMWGKGGVEALDARLDFDIKDIQPEGLYLPGYQRQIVNYIVKEHGTEYLRKLGRFSAREVKLMRYFGMFTNPVKVLAKMNETLAATNLRNEDVETDVLTVEETDKGLLVTANGVMGNENQIEIWIGIFEGILELTRNPGKVVIADKSKLEDECTLTFGLYYK